MCDLLSKAEIENFKSTYIYANNRAYYIWGINVDKEMYGNTYKYNCYPTLSIFPVFIYIEKHNIFVFRMFYATAQFAQFAKYEKPYHFLI